MEIKKVKKIITFSESYTSFSNLIRFDIAISYEYKINKKEHIIINGMDDYLNAINNENNKKKNNHQTEKSEEISSMKGKHEKNDQNFIEKLEKMNFNVPIDKQKKIKKANMTLWISDEFPMKFVV